MIAIILCILANVGIFLSFRLFQYYRLNTFQAIAVNYVICVLTGIVFKGWAPVRDAILSPEPWLIWAALLGILFIGTFYLMARTTQVYSMTVASIATKMSLIIPVLFSLLVLGTRSRDYTVFNYAGILIALAAILLSSMKRKPGHELKSGSALFLLPISVFLLGGTIDTVLNTVNQRYLSEEKEAIFPVFIFLTAGLIGMVILLIRRVKLSISSLIGGFFLGIVNYFSVYFLLMALRNFSNDGA
ncbi:MAG: hypothetical protein P8X57_12455, partial [Cyclobacteriaceae bacterium]